MTSKFAIGDKVNTLAAQSDEVKSDSAEPGTIVSCKWDSNIHTYVYEVRWPEAPDEKYPAEYNEDELVRC